MLPDVYRWLLATRSIVLAFVYLLEEMLTNRFRVATVSVFMISQLREGVR